MPSEDMDEHRNAVRALTYLSGRVALDAASAETTPCLVRNLSPIGARVAFCTTVEVPDSFDLFIDPGDNAYRAHRIWSKGNEVGVLFHEARANAPEVLCDDVLGDDRLHDADPAGGAIRKP